MSVTGLEINDRLARELQKDDRLVESLQVFIHLWLKSYEPAYTVNVDIGNWPATVSATEDTEPLQEYIARGLEVFCSMERIQLA